MPTYELTQAVWVLQYNTIKGVEATSGKEALEKVHDEGIEWAFNDNSDDSFGVSYECADLETEGPPYTSEVYQINCNDLRANTIEEFLLLSPKGWRHS